MNPILRYLVLQVPPTRDTELATNSCWSVWRQLKQGGGSVMVWSCMSVSGIGKMITCKGRMDSKKCIEVLKKVLDIELNMKFGDMNLDGLRFNRTLPHATIPELLRVGLRKIV